MEGGGCDRRSKAADREGNGAEEVCRRGWCGNGAGRAPECGGFDRAQVL